MSVEQLRQILTPPAQPHESGPTNDWHAVEEQLGQRLPDDYKSFVDVYGTGKISGFIWVFNPFSRNSNLNLLKQVPRQLQALRTLQSQFGAAIAYPLFPDPEGLLPWGVTDNGNVLFWRTTGSPNDWPVVVGASRAPEFEEYERPLSDFLTELLLQRLSSKILPQENLNGPHVFVPS